MAYEIGNNNYNYFSNGLKLYALDSSIYSKASNFLSLFKPYEIKYNINYIEDMLSNLIGDNLADFFFNGKYIQIEQENRKKLTTGEISESEYNSAAIWDYKSGIKEIFEDENLPPDDYTEIDLSEKFKISTLECFKNDITAFYNSIKPYLKFYGSIEKPSTSLVDIKVSLDYENTPKSIQLLRNDGESIIFDVDENDINYLLNVIEEVRNMKNNE